MRPVVPSVGESDRLRRCVNAPAAELHDETAFPKSEHEHCLHLIESAVPEIHRFVARRVANKADAEDIAQQVLLQAVAKLDTFRGANLRAWLYTIARRLIIDHYRARNRVQHVEVVEAALSETEPSLRTREDAVQSRCDCRIWLGQWVDCIIRQLRLEEQVAVLLADVHGHSDKGSAAELGMTLPSFKLLLHGARSRLNQAAGGACLLLSGARTAIGVDSPAMVTALRVDGTDSKRGGCVSHWPQSISPAPRYATGAGCRTNGRASAEHGSCTQESSPAHSCSAGSACRRCCFGFQACLSSKCCFGVGCRLGIKCCREVPRLLALRARLLRALVLYPMEGRPLIECPAAST